MKNNPNIEISAMAGDEWIRLTRTVVQAGNNGAKQAMLDANIILQDMYKIDDDVFEVLHITNATTTFYSFTGEPEAEML